MPDLTLNLKYEYFDAVKDGQKTEEYRLFKPYWTKRLEGRNYDNVVFCRGYPAKDDAKSRLVMPYAGYEVKTITHPHFGSKPVKVYAIRAADGGKDKPMKTYTAKKAAEFLQMKIASLNHHCRKGHLEPVMEKGIRQFAQADLEAFAAKEWKHGAEFTEPRAGCYTLQEVIKLLRISRQRIHVLAKRGGWKVGRGLFNKDLVDEHLANKSGPVCQEPGH